MPRPLSKRIFPPKPQTRLHHTCLVTCSINPPWSQHPSRAISTSSKRSEAYKPISQPSPPRWQATPPQMVAPVRVRQPAYHPEEFKVNESSALLDEVYVKVLGNGGEDVLTEEVKWLAVTHKSFDHGRRGYNDRLAFLGNQAYSQIIPRILMKLRSREANHGITNLPSNPYNWSFVKCTTNEERRIREATLSASCFGRP